MLVHGDLGSKTGLGSVQDQSVGLAELGDGMHIPYSALGEEAVGILTFLGMAYMVELD